MSHDREARAAEFFAALETQFRQRCAEEAEVIALYLDGQSERTALIATLHRVAGSGGTFGYSDLSDAAFALEDAARDGQLDTSALTALHERLRAVSRGD